MTQDELDKMDRKQKALLSLTLAAQAFHAATCDELEAKGLTGRAQANRGLVEDGRANVCISIQMSNKEIRAVLALVDPVFVDVLDTYEMRLCGPIEAAFADPAKLTIHDLAKMN